LASNGLFRALAMESCPRGGRPLRSWKIFLRNHVEEIAAIDLFAVPAIAFR
jgi:hypothetical protein